MYVSQDSPAFSELSTVLFLTINHRTKGQYNTHYITKVNTSTVIITTSGLVSLLLKMEQKMSTSKLFKLRRRSKVSAVVFFFLF